MKYRARLTLHETDTQIVELETSKDGLGRPFITSYLRTDALRRMSDGTVFRESTISLAGQPDSFLQLARVPCARATQKAVDAVHAQTLPRAREIVAQRLAEEVPA